jgi:hypothetical protein
MLGHTSPSMPHKLKAAVRPRSDRRALILYVIVWLAAGAVVAATLLVAMRGDGVDDAAQISLPPVRQTELATAADTAGCLLRAGSRRARNEPVVEGAAAPPAAAQYYESPPAAASLVGAMRRGIVVISYRPELAPEHRDRLRVLQRAVPSGTIVAPNAAMPFVIAVTAWRRLLGCRRVGAGTLDAMRLFLGRFVGSGPDSGCRPQVRVGQR